MPIPASMLPPDPATPAPASGEPLAEKKRSGERGEGRIRDPGAGLGDTNGKGLTKIKHIHDRIIDIVLASSQKLTYEQIAKVTSYTVSGISFIMNSDAFRARMAERRSEVIDPLISKNFEETLSELGDLAARDLMDRIRNRQLSNKELIATVTASTKAAAYGARVPGDQQTVVFVPARAATAAEWAAGARPGEVVDAVVTETRRLDGSAQ